MKALNWLVVSGTLLCGCAGNGDDGDDEGDGSCLGVDALAKLNTHAEDLRVSAAMLAGHPGPREAIGFFRFVGLEVQRTAVYAGPLVMACTEPLVYDEFCEEDGLCSQIECTGDGAGWEMHFGLQMPTTGEVAYQSATVDTAWADGADGIAVAMAADAGDWSMTGSGAMDTESFELEETYPSLRAGGPTVLTIADTSEGVHGGTITIGGEVVAEVDVDGIYVPTAACQ